MYMRITSSANLPLSILLTIGAAKTAYDYKQANEKDKKSILIRNGVIVGSSIAGVVTAQKYADKVISQQPVDKAINSFSKWVVNLPKPKFLKHFFESLLDANHNNKIDPKEDVTQFTEIVQNCFKDCFMVCSAIGAGIIGGEALNLTYFKNRKKPNGDININSLKPNYNLKENPDDGLEQISKVLGGDFKVLKAVDQPMAMFDALKITEGKDATTKMKMTAYELIANALVPTFFISIAMSMTKNLSLLKRIGLVSASAALGLLLGHKCALQFNRSVTPEIAKNIEELTDNIPLPIE